MGTRLLVAAALAFDIQGAVFVVQGRQGGVLAVPRGAIAFGQANGAALDRLNARTSLAR